MANAQLGTVLGHLRKLFGEPAAAEPADGQLLERFTSHGEEAAFAALLQRHGPLVLGVCRRLLPDPADADDAFQAAFIVLVRKAGTYTYREEKAPPPGPDATWKNCAPVIHDGKVVFTAPDGDAIHCLKLSDGKLLWKADRKDDLYLAGVFGNRVLLVGTKHCQALNLADGKVAWGVETGVPSGLGIAAGNLYYLPLKEEINAKQPGVCVLDPVQGHIVLHSRAPKQEAPGNLLFHDGLLLSQTVGELTAFPPAK